MSLWIVLGIVLLLLIMLFYTKIGIGAKYENGTFVIFKISFKSFEIPFEKVYEKFFKQKKEEPEKEKEEGEETPEKEIDKGISKLDFVLSLLGDFRFFVRKHFSLEKFNLDIRFGTAEAASTAITTGLLWTLSSSVLSLIDQFLYVKKPKINITPVFDDATFSIKAGGIITARLVYIIAAAIIIAYKFYKYKNTISRRTNK